MKVGCAQGPRHTTNFYCSFSPFHSFFQRIVGILVDVFVLMGKGDFLCGEALTWCHDLQTFAASVVAAMPKG